jgi:uncharacterized glyoxalase superfamily protein PhnB
MRSHIYPVTRYARGFEAIDWLCKAFGFERKAVFEGPAGSVAHAELAFGSGMFGLSSSGPVDPANVWTTVREGVYACVEDLDALHARARQAGAVIEIEPRNTDYGSREFTARDHEGRLWGFGTYAMGDVPAAPALWPELRARNGRAAVDFFTRAFGLEPGLQVGSEGDIRHAELWIGSGVVMIDGSPDSGQHWRGLTQCIHAYVEHPDAHHDVARAAGAHIVRPLEDTPYGSRQYQALDLEGFLWSFGTYRPHAPTQMARTNTDVTGQHR